MFSALQKFILKDLSTSRGASPEQFQRYYSKQSNPPKQQDQQTSITRSLERLIDAGCVTGKGRRTKEKWFFDEVKLTPEGRRQVKRLFEQPRLPLFTRKNKYGTIKKN